MKAYFYTLENFGEFDFNENKVLSIETNNRRFFLSLVKNLKNIESDGRETAFYEKDKLLSLDKDYLLLLDYFDTEPLTKTINSKVLKNLSAELEKSPEKVLEFSLLIAKLYAFTLTRLDETDIVFESDGERSFDEVLKLFSVSVAQPRGDIFSKILNLVEVAGELGVFKLFVFVNAKSFFVKNELNEIMKMAKYLGVSLMLVDNIVTKEKISDETLLCVDEDFFEYVF